MSHALISPALAESLLPTDEEVRSFQELGYYVSRSIIPDEMLDRALEGCERFYRGERDGSLPGGIRMLGWTPEQGDVLRKNDYASMLNRELSALVRSPIIGAIAARLTGSPIIRLWHDQLLYKPVDRPERRMNVGWHTDRGYWKTCTSAAMLTAWIPFHDCDESMGTVSMIAGSNHWPDNTEKLDFFNPDLTALEREFITGGAPVTKVPMILRKGQMSFHSCLTIHGSGPNRSGRPRRSIAVHLQDETNRFRIHVHPSGRVASHANDHFVRRVDGLPDYTDPDICPMLHGGGADGKGLVRTGG